METALPLTAGDGGEAVRDLQRRLTRAGFHLGTDGIGRFGPGTGEALIAFQRDRGLRPDGVCAAQTWAALVEAGYQLGDRLLYSRSPMLRGDDVASLQASLGRLGFFPDRVDGIFGPRTASSLLDFQRNGGLTADGICGPDTVEALARLGPREARSVKGGLVEREHLRSAPHQLHGRRVVVGDTGGVAALADVVQRHAGAAGAVVLVSAHPDQSSQAEEANRFQADAYLGLALRAEAGSTTAYYASPHYESTGGRRLAERVASGMSDALPGSSTISGMRLPVLRETRMPAVLCEVGPPEAVVEHVARLAVVVVEALRRWAVSPVDT